MNLFRLYDGWSSMRARLVPLCRLLFCYARFIFVPGFVFLQCLFYYLVSILYIKQVQTRGCSVAARVLEQPWVQFCSPVGHHRNPKDERREEWGKRKIRWIF
ncbi:unnamed protein product [Ixodes persulcatus]